MTFRCLYKTPAPFDDLMMESDGEVLTGLFFAGSREGGAGASGGDGGGLQAFGDTRRWLDAYFSGRAPGFLPRFRLPGATAFREEVCRELLDIPFGSTTSYGAIAAAIAGRRGMAKMSARAVGGAVGWNPVAIVVPCHRVVGADGSPTGYGGGLPNKLALLRLEGIVLCH